jgi:hypothetical protein
VNDSLDDAEATDGSAHGRHVASEANCGAVTVRLRFAQDSPRMGIYHDVM